MYEEILQQLLEVIKSFIWIDIFRCSHCKISVSIEVTNQKKKLSTFHFFPLVLQHIVVFLPILIDRSMSLRKIYQASKLLWFFLFALILSFSLSRVTLCATTLRSWSLNQPKRRKKLTCFNDLLCDRHFFIIIIIIMRHNCMRIMKKNLFRSGWKN